MATREATVHRLKVTLRGVKPPVWRRIEVPSTTKLTELSDLLEAAMGWLGGHLHAYEAQSVRYEIPDGDNDRLRERRDERKARLGDVLWAPKAKMRWDYDFGDGWQHDIVVEAIEAMSAQAEYPVCTGGARACPPEDCGGPRGYDSLLAALGDPAHELHEKLREWAPGFDPEAFDVAEATTTMRTDRPLRDW
jgi:hypothetical protein